MVEGKFVLPNGVVTSNQEMRGLQQKLLKYKVWYIGTTTKIHPCIHTRDNHLLLRLENYTVKIHK